MYAYVAALWTVNADNTPRLHDHLGRALPDGYLGYLDQPRGLELTTFHEISAR